MFRLRDVSLPTKLYGLVIGYSILVAAVLTLAGYLLYTYRVHGPVYQQIAAQKQLASETSPPYLFIGPAYIAMQELETADEDDTIGDIKLRYEEARSNYTTRREYWINQLPDGPIGRGIEREFHEPANRFFRLADDYIKNVESNGDQAHRVRLRKQIKENFDTHRSALMQTLEKIEEQAAADEAAALEDSRYWTRVMTTVSIVLVVVMGATGLWVGRAVVQSVRVINERVHEMATGAGDLTARVPVTGTDEMGQLAQGINAVIAKIQGIVSRVRESSLQLLSVASQIAATARNQEETANNLGTSTTQVAASVREISATSTDLSGTMNEVSQSAAHAAELATGGRDNAGKMAAEMKQLVESTTDVSTKLGMIREKADSINAVVTTITKVADQTNLLSINAAIEAEKAGEYGRGFLVVAREIRRLADQTAVATLDIETMVKQMQDSVSAGVMQMDKFADEVRSGVGQVTRINQMTYEIITEVQGLSSRFKLVNDGMKNQAQGAQHINDAMATITDAARRTAQSIQEFERATAHLRTSVEGLNAEIAQFKI